MANGTSSEGGCDLELDGAFDVDGLDMLRDHCVEEYVEDMEFILRVGDRP